MPTLLDDPAEAALFLEAAASGEPGYVSQWRTLRHYPDGQVGELFLDATLMPPYGGRQLILLSAYGPSFHISSTDPMTGCLNRRAMDTALRASAGTGHLILLDLNGFKRFNDMYGHEAGDHVLRSVAERLRSGVNDQGAVFRMGGDEFGILVPESDTARAEELLRRVVTSIAEPLTLGHDTLTVSAAAGMTILGSDHPLRVFRQADQAMYLAKSRGVPYAVFGRELPAWAGSRTAMFAAVDRLSAERDELADLARTDWLTKLGNPLAMSEAFDHVTAQARRSGRPYSVLFVDIDYFSHYNHVHGDDEGDEVLKAVAGLLQDSCRGGDVVYRKGGEEFVVLLPDTFSATAVGVAERLRGLIERQELPHLGRPSGPPILTVTVGVATLGPRDREGSDSVRVRAGRLVMDAKKIGELGRNRVHVEPAP